MENIKIILTNKKNKSIKEIRELPQNTAGNYYFILDYSDNWNDYNFRSLLNLAVVADKEVKIDDEHFQGFHVDSDRNWTMGKFVEETYSSQEVELDNLPPQIVTFASTELYKKIFNVLPREIVNEFLLKVNDICFNEKTANKLAIANEASQDKVWPEFVTVSFFRDFFEENRWSSYGEEDDIKNESQKSAWIEECKKITSHLNIVHAQLVDGFSNKLIFNVSSEQFFKGDKKSYAFDVTLRNDVDLAPLPTNCFAIIGVNGIGKTTLLRNILKKFDFDKTENSVFSQIALISFDDNSEPIPEKYEDYRHVIVGIDSAQLENQTFEKVADGMLRSLEKIATNQDSVGKDIEAGLNEAFGNFDFDSTMNSIIQSMKNYMNSIKEKGNSIFDNTNSDDVKEKRNNLRSVLLTMSSGQKMIFSILLSLGANILPKSMVLIDEPENTLHPPFIMALIYSINVLAKKQDSMVIVSTHSPIIVQEMNNDNVLIMYENKLDNTIGLKHPTIQTFAASIDALNDYIFGLDIRMSGHVKFLNAVHKLNPNLTLEDIKEKWKLSPHAMAYVAKSFKEEK